MPILNSFKMFFKKYISRRFLGSTIIAPMVVSYGLAHNWPAEVINHLLLILGIGVGSIAVVDAVAMNRGFKKED